MRLKVVEDVTFATNVDQAATLSCSAKPEPRKGRCWHCSNAFFWPAHRLRLRDARCPLCGSVLSSTVWYLKSIPWHRCTVEADVSAKVAR